jgi:hypothetical protein
VAKRCRSYRADSTLRQYDGMAPTPFFGELTKTSEGCMYLKEKGIVPEFAEIVRLHGMEENDQAILTNVKSVLWALVRDWRFFQVVSRSL